MATVLVTGANRGIGLEFVRQYAADGDTVFACCRNPEGADALAKIAAGSNGRVRVHPLDVADGGSVERLAGALKHEPIDLLINNAGIIGTRSGRPDYALWEEVLRVNAIGPYRMAEAFHDNLKKTATRKIVTITSGMGSTANNGGGYYPYRSSKAAVNNIMRGLSHDWGHDGFIVIVIHPGWVQTDMGGRGASLSPKESVAAMRKIFARLKPSDNGTFLDYRGNTIAW
jgi:NAD(P)-dependent dehydrogenase (short-subunit alcohol dehydrogenase family)